MSVKNKNGEYKSKKLREIMNNEISKQKLEDTCCRIKENKKFTKKLDSNKATKEPVWFNKVNEASQMSDADKEELENLLKEFK